MIRCRFSTALTAAIATGVLALATSAFSADAPPAKSDAKMGAGHMGAGHMGGGKMAGGKMADSKMAGDKMAGSMDKGTGMDMPMPKPGPEHAMLQKCVGKWNAKVTMTMAPGAPAMTMQGVEDVTSINNGLFIEIVHHGVGGMPYEGHGFSGYDQVTKKYTSIWCDSWGSGTMTAEGTADAKGTVISTTSMSNPMTGKVETGMMSEAMPDDNTRLMKMWQGTDMSVPPMMEITYTRATGGTESAHK